MLLAPLAVLTLIKVSVDHYQRRRGRKAYTLKLGNTVTDRRNNEERRREVHKMSKNSQKKDKNSEEENLNGTNVDSHVITFRSGDRDYQEIRSKSVTIIGSAGTHDHGSSKVKLKNVVDYKWENKHYPGHLIAVHIDGKFIAYAINVNNKSRMEGMVRVVNPQSGMRALIKGMCGEVLDLQFAHIQQEKLLASIDMNSMFVHKIEVHKDTLLCNLILKIDDPLRNYTPTYDKVSWCPFVEASIGEDEGENHIVVWLRGSTFQCFNVKTVIADHKGIVMAPKDLKTGYIRFHDESLTFTWATLSPDGSTLGVGSTEGTIRFFQVYMHDKDSRCLHQWKPYTGKPVSSFFFLDDLTRCTVDTYWKHAITGAVHNTELKVWDCGNWECLQTVNLSTVTDGSSSAKFIAEMDRTSSYLVVSSLETRTCYVLQIVNLCPKDGEPEKDSSVGSSVSTQSSNKQVSLLGLVYIKSVAEFPLHSGILSFSIVDAAVRRFKNANENYNSEEFDDFDEENGSIYCVVIRMFIVQSKSMQECHIIYQPMLTEDADVKSSILYDSSSGVGVRDSPTNPDSGVTSLRKPKSAANECEGSQIDLSSGGFQSNTGQSERGAFDSLLGINVDGSASTTLEETLGMLSSSCSVSPQKSLNLTDTASTMCTVKVMTVSSTNSTNGVPNGSGNGSGSGTGYGQVNLMTPDEFTSSSANDKNTPDTVSTEVLNTLLMLASVAGQTGPPSKAEGINLFNLVNNKMLEDHEHHKLQMKALESEKKFIAIDNNPGRKVSDNLASGGSSPSREVQEIMSLQDFDKSPFSGDELIDGVQPADGLLSTKSIAATDLEPTASVNAKSQVTKWPKAPDVSKQKHSAELQNAANLISQTVHASSVGNLNSSHLMPPLISNNSNNNNNMTGNVQKSELADMSKQLGKLMEMVKMQSKQINGLQKEIADMKNANAANTTKTVNEFAFKTEIQLSKLMEQYLKRYENEHNKKLAAFMSGRDAQNREMRESFMQMVNQYFLTQLGDVVSKVLAIELQRQLIPTLSAGMDNMQKQIQLDIAQKLATFDMMLKENINQVCKSKSFIEAFGKSVLLGVQGSLQTAFIESMSSTLIPAYEKSSQNMFKQLHDAFSVGIKEFMEQFDNYLQQLQPMQKSTEQIVNNFAGFRQHMDAILTKQRNVVMEAMTETRKDMKNIEISLTRQIQEVFRMEMRKCLDNSAMAAIRSQANTPAPGYDMKETVRHLLHSGQINKAFHQALLANDLTLVEYTLKNADHNAIFTPNCCLEQKVLLSLIQQISADMSHHNELKQNYLAEALLAINPADPITREHAPKVLQELFRNCQQFLYNFPKSPQYSNVRMLIKAIQAFKDQF